MTKLIPRSKIQQKKIQQFWNTNRKYLKGGPINKTLSKEEWDKDVSDQYSNRYPNLINTLDLFIGEPYIKGRLEYFTKGDSAVYTPILDRVETYLLNNDIATEQEKENARIAGNMLAADLIFSGSRDRKEVSSGLKFLNSLLEKVTDDDIKKFANSDILHIGLLLGLKLIPKGLSIKDMFKLKKYVSSDLFKEDHFGASKFGDWLRSGGTNSLDAWAYGNYGILE